MTILTYILRRVVEKSKYPIFNICPMYFFPTEDNKLENIKERVLENDFFSDNQKKIYMELFSKAQKYYHAFTRLGRLWKHFKVSNIEEKDVIAYPSSNPNNDN